MPQRNPHVTGDLALPEWNKTFLLQAMDTHFRQEFILKTSSGEDHYPFSVKYSHFYNNFSQCTVKPMGDQRNLRMIVQVSKNRLQ